MQPKTKERLSNFRRANRRMPRRRMDIPTDKLVYKNPELLAKFTSLTVGGRPVCGKYLAFGPAGCKTRACRFAHVDSSNNVVTQH